MTDGSHLTWAGGRLHSLLVLTFTILLTTGTFGLSSGFLGQQFNNSFFKVVACVDTVVVIFFWFWVSAKCIQQTIDGRLFFKQGFHESHSKDHLHRTQRDWNGSSSIANQRANVEEGANDTERQ